MFAEDLKIDDTHIQSYSKELKDHFMVIVYENDNYGSAVEVRQCTKE